MGEASARAYHKIRHERVRQMGALPQNICTEHAFGWAGRIIVAGRPDVPGVSEAGHA